jgi:histone deacetylase 11
VKAFYNPRYNIDLGVLNRLHPFDGRKFGRVVKEIEGAVGLSLVDVSAPVDEAAIARFASPLLQKLLLHKRYVLQALEVPYLPLVPLSFIDRKILEPMRWGAAGTLAAARVSVRGANCWNLAGGYHHASRTEAEGFCIYNDIGIAIQALRESGELSDSDEVLIVDIDAHHGNGNARVFMDDRRIRMLDIYNDDIYPRSPYTKERIDINLPLRMGTNGQEYLTRLEGGLSEIPGGARLAFVVAGTDVLASDPLGGLRLSVDDCVARDRLVLDRLAALGVPAVFTGGGGYGPESAAAMTRSLLAHAGR